MTKKILSLTLAAVMLLTALFSLSSSAASFTRGDVDADEKISSADARLALRGAVGLENLTADFLMRADVDADGTVHMYENTLDAVIDFFNFFTTTGGQRK